mmetsp:Transcript_28169/g.40338  ORF Transcript_28169/g.40338 Transcript_28169/m.40338 type:complete len:509 (+) Transcript_28169:52-1578(+)
MTGKIYKAVLLHVVLLLGYVSLGMSASRVGSVVPSPTRRIGSMVTLPPKTLPRKKLLVPETRQHGVVTRGGALPNETSSQMIGVALFIGMDITFRKVFKALDISFPSQLGGCVILFTVFSLLSTFSTGAVLADSIVSVLSPGASWLAKFLPVFFVPGLAMLPVAPSVGSLLEVFKYLSIIVVGFLFTLTTTAFAVEFVGKMGDKVPLPESGLQPQLNTAPASAKPPFTAETLKYLLSFAVISGAVSIAATRESHPWAKPVQTAFLTIATVSGFVFASRLPAAFTKVVHPLATSTLISLGSIKLLSVMIGNSFEDVLRTFRTGSLGIFKGGAGDLLLFMLGAAVISFSIPMYGRRLLIKDNLPVVLTACLTSSLGGLFGTAFYVRLIQVASETVRRSVLPRFITTALAIAVSNMLEGSVPITATAVVLTGIIGATYGRTLLDLLGIKTPISRGLAIGAASQGLGVASMVNEKEAFPFAAVSMVMTAVCATTLVSIPLMKKVLLKIALES